MYKFSKGKQHSKSSFSIGDGIQTRMKTSYQLNHHSIKPDGSPIENQKKIEMCCKRMRDSNVFNGKFHDTLDHHDTKLETSYKVAVVTEKQPLISQNKGKSNIFLPQSKFGLNFS